MQQDNIEIKEKLKKELRNFENKLEKWIDQIETCNDNQKTFQNKKFTDKSNNVRCQ
jgi:hypothetical protein